MTLVIGLTGKARHGKGSVVQLSQILLQTGDDELEVRQVSFATALKAMAADLVLLADNKLAIFDYLRGRGLLWSDRTREVIESLRTMALELTLADLKAKTPKARRFLQYLGTEAFRVHVDDLFWVKKAIEEVEALPEETKIVFIPDCRFTNEADYIKKVGGLLWRVERYTVVLDDFYGDTAPKRIPYDNGLTPEQKAHPSETQLDGYPVDATLVAGDMGELFEAVKRQIEHLQKGGKL